MKQGTASTGGRQPGLVAGLAGLVLLAAAAGAVSNAFAGPERRLEWIGRNTVAAGIPAPATAPASSGASASVSPGTTAAASTASAASTEAKPWKEIGTDEAEKLHKTGVLFLDARRSSVYREGHIAGARSVPVWEAGLDDKVKAFFAELTDQTVPIVVYCSGGDCEDSHELAQKLYLAGFDGVRVYKDGYPDWERRKLPVARGEKP